VGRGIVEERRVARQWIDTLPGLTIPRRANVHVDLLPGERMAGRASCSICISAWRSRRHLSVAGQKPLAADLLLEGHRRVSSLVRRRSSDEEHVDVEDLGQVVVR